MKKSSVFNFLTVCAAALIMAFSSGCALALIGLGVGAGIAGTKYYEGKLTSTREVTPEQVKNATEKAFDALKIKIITSTSNALEAKVTGKTEDDKDVTVSAELQKEGTTEIGIRVGTFGDQPLSEKIYLEMDKNLPKKEEKK
jgi:hypothetical protein